MSIKGFFTNLFEQLKKNTKGGTKDNKVDEFISDIKSEIGIQVTNTEKVGNKICIESDLCMIYYGDSEIRIAFDVRSMPEQACMILYGLHNICGIDKVKILQSYYYQSNNNDSILVGEDALYKYIEHITSNVAYKMVQDQMNKLKILEQYESDIMQ